MKKIAITGSKGFLGENVVDYFGSKYQISEYDIVDRKRCLDLIYDDVNQFDAIIHMAAISNVADEKKVYSVIQENIDNLAKICQYLRDVKWKGRFIFFSSAMIYANRGGLYGATKILGEAVVKSLLDNWIILRPFNMVGGKFPDTENGRILIQLVECLRQNEPFAIYNKGRTKRFYPHMDNLLKTLDNALVGENKRTIVVRSDRMKNIFDVIKVFEKVSGAKIKTFDGGEKSWIVSTMEMDKEKVEESISNADEDLEKAIRDHLSL